MKNPAAPAYLTGPLRYSYAAVGAAVVLALAAPDAVAYVLVPLLVVGMVVLGIAHGACDQFVVPGVNPARRVGQWRYLLRFGMAYLALAAVVVGLWWWWPGFTVGLFFLLTAWHWGSADAPRQRHSATLWVAHSLTRGAFLFAVPALCWPAETRGIVNDLLTFAGGAPVAAPAFARGAAVLGPVAAGGLLLVWSLLAWRRAYAPLRADLTQTLVLLVLLAALPPVLSVAVYFVFWHSLQHVLRMNRVMGYAADTAAGYSGRELLRQLGFFTRRALPLLLVSLGAIWVLYQLMLPRLPDGSALFSLALVVASVVTLPHALLVSLVLDKGEVVRL